MKSSFIVQGVLFMFIFASSFRPRSIVPLRKMLFATKLPRDIEIPIDRLEFAFSRSSGPGGQNVNRLSTKAEIRFHVLSADWIPYEVRLRLSQYQANKINKEGELIITAQEHRTQGKNKDLCIDKLKVMIAEAYMEPKDRILWEGLNEKAKEINLKEKRQHSAKKEARRSKSFFDD